MSSLTINDLPTEIIYELFDRLPLKDLASCSLVNKRWHFIYSRFRLTSLAVNQDTGLKYLSEWHDSKQIIESEECSSRTLISLVNKPLLSKLKRLFVSDLSAKFDLNSILNGFQNLVHLEINILCLFEDIHLELFHLKILVFHKFSHLGSWSLDCPNLSVLVYNEPERMNLLKMKHPETIRKLTTNMTASKLTSFQNLEYLFTGSLKVLSKATLLSLPKLKGLYYNLSVGETFDNQVDSFASLKQVLREFEENVKAFGNPNFEFYFAGFRMIKTRLNAIDFGEEVAEREESKCNEYIYMKNWRLIDPGCLSFVRQLDYTRLMSHASGQSPECISRKFTGVWQVTTSGAVQDPKHFLQFLKTLSSLRRLSLDRSQLGQEHYDQLPASASRLLELDLRGNDDQWQLNFEFIGKLSGLTWLYTNLNLSLESLISLVRCIGELTAAFFYLQMKKNLFCIRKRKTRWTVQDFSLSVFETHNTEVVINYFETLSDGESKTDGASD